MIGIAATKKFTGGNAGNVRFVDFQTFGHMAIGGNYPFLLFAKKKVLA